MPVVPGRETWTGRSHAPMRCTGWAQRCKLSSVRLGFRARRYADELCSINAEILRIVDRDLAACHDLGVDPHIDVAESTLEGGDNIEVPFRGNGIDLRRCASGDRRDHPQPGCSEGDFRLDPVVLAPRCCSVEINIRTKPQRVDRYLHRR